MALHTETKIYKHAYQLLNLSIEAKANMRRDFKNSLGTRIHDECIEVLVLIAAITSIAPYAAAARAGACFDPQTRLWHNLPVSSEIGFGDPKQPCSAGRRTQAVRAALLSVPQVMAARTGGRKACRFPRGLSGSPTRSSCRHRLATWAAAVANHSPRRPTMAKTPARRSAPRIAVIDGQPTTTSRDIAETFGKRHDDVLKRIRSLDCSPEFTARNFAASEYTDPTGRQLTEYRITRDGFAFLCMGFTGARAAQWKERYINTFNRMAERLAAKSAKRMTSALPEPALPDLRTAMMHGLPAPVPLNRDQQAMVNRRAWALAHEAYELVREHIERVVTWRTTAAMRDQGHPALARAINEVTLGQALAHPQAQAAHSARTMLRALVTALQNSAADAEREFQQATTPLAEASATTTGGKP